MDAVRLLHPKHYSYKRKRFVSLAFKNSGEVPGISIIDCECLFRTTDTICDHIRKYYRITAGEPPIYWRFDTGILPGNFKLEQEDSPAGDECHYNIRGITDKAAKSLFKNYWDKLHLFKICKNGDAFQLKEADIPDFSD